MTRFLFCLAQWIIAGSGLFGTHGCALAGGVVAGRVIDIDTGRPVAGAYVYGRCGYQEICPLEGGGCHCIDFDAQATTTNQDGYYRFDRPFKFGGTLLNDRFGAVAVFKAEYVSAKGNSELTDYSYQLHNLYHHFFFGSGRYADYYNEHPLTSGSSIYYLTRNVDDMIEGRSDNQQVTPRIQYLSNVTSGFGAPGCLDDESIKRVSSPMRKAIYEEARNVARTPEDQKLAHRICRYARGYERYGPPPYTVECSNPAAPASGSP